MLPFAQVLESFVLKGTSIAPRDSLAEAFEDQSHQKPVLASRRSISLSFSLPPSP